MARAEGGSAKEQAEGAQAVGVLRADKGFQVYFAVAAGAGAGAAVIEAPDAAIGEDAPADAPVRTDVGGGQVAEDLGVGRTGMAALVAVACVQGQAEAFALSDDQRVGVAILAGLGSGAGLGVGIAKEQMVGDVFVAFIALLGQVVGPAEQIEQGADQVLLGRQLRWRSGRRRPGLRGRRPRRGRRRSRAAGRSDSCHASVWRMPSVRKYWVKSWPGMGSG